MPIIGNLKSNPKEPSFEPLTKSIDELTKAITDLTALIVRLESKKGV